MDFPVLTSCQVFAKGRYIVHLSELFKDAIAISIRVFSQFNSFGLDQRI